MQFVRRLLQLFCLLILCFLFPDRPGAQVETAETTTTRVLFTVIEGPIGPATVHHVAQVLEHAKEEPTEAVVLQLNTPGGLADAMREIITEILVSPVPVITYVAPPGAHAASAGTYIVYASHVAAMAPGTNLGAATPVAIGGLPEGFPDLAPEEGEDAEKEAAEDEAADPLKPQDAMTAKATNDAVALIRSLAEIHGRNADWAETAVRQARSLSAVQALELNVIDLIAADLPALLREADGRSVVMGETHRELSTAGQPVEVVQMDVVTRILSVLSNPNVALILMMLGIYGLMFEFWNPGAIVPGVVGAICLTLGLYALNQLPLNYAGLALVGLGVAFMVAEAFSPSFGILGLGGIVAFSIGAAMLVDTDVAAYRISWWLIGTMALVSASVLVVLLGYTIRTYRRQPVSGSARMLGAQGRVLEWSGDAGFVWVEGERWRARGGAGLRPGQIVHVRGMDGLILDVEADNRNDPAPIQGGG